MKVTTKKISDTSVELKVVLDANDLKEAEKKAVERLIKDVKVEGFRKGKAPLDIAKNRINPNDLSSVALDIAVRTSVPKAFDESETSPLMIPNVEVMKFVPGETVEYTAKADILPEIKLGDYKKLGVKKAEAKVTEKEVTEMAKNSLVVLLKISNSGLAHTSLFLDLKRESSAMKLASVLISSLPSLKIITQTI